MELHIAIQEARHERIAGADRIDHLGGEARHACDVAAWLDGRSTTWPECDHRKPQAVLFDPTSGQLNWIAATVAGATAGRLGEELDVLVACLDDPATSTDHTKPGL